MTDLILLIKFIFGFSTGIDITGKAIIYLIWFLFLIGIIDLIFYWIATNFEKVNLREVRNRFNNISNPGVENVGILTRELIRELPSISGIGNLVALLPGQIWVPDTSTVVNRLEELHRIREEGGEINHDALAEILSIKYNMKAGLVRYLLSSLIILGLMGTFWGLGKSVAQIQPLLTKPENFRSLSDLCNRMSETLGGMSTAFATTLAGLVATLILAFLYYRFNKYQTSFLTELEDFTTTSLIPRFCPKEKTAVSKMSDTFKESADSMCLASRMLSETSYLMTSRLDQLDTFVNSFGESTTTLVEGMKGISNIKHYVDKIGEISNSLKELLTETTLLSLQKESVEIKDIINKFTTSQIELFNNLNTSIETANKGFSSNLDGILEENREQVEKIFSAQKEVIVSLQRIVDGFNWKIGQEEKQGEILKDLSQNINELNKFLSKRAQEEQKRRKTRKRTIIALIILVGILIGGSIFIYLSEFGLGIKEW
ncbi:MAG: hypothetical protein AB1414_07810 [bacterium]